MANLFGSLNRFISRLDSDLPTHPPTTNTPHPPKQTTQGYGFQILRNTSPSIPLEPWFDFIIGINSRTLSDSSPQLFTTELLNGAGTTISLGIYSAKGQRIREIYLPIPPDTSTTNLGLTLQWTPLSIADEIWHILDVMPNSPADVAGLLPHGDYVLGSPDGAVKGDAGLGALVEAFLERPLRLWVYNCEYDVTRLVTITPARAWGGEGSLGCVLGYGVLHRIPPALEEPTQGPGETLFEVSASAADGSGEGREFLVPADLPMGEGPGGAAVPPPPPAGKAKKAKAHHAPAVGLDDYFAEGEQRSRELDKPSTPKVTGGLPPPPKAGGPMKAASPAPAAGEEEA
ncbi:hypothetical protein EJ03DRAFT_318082 [Teratosphaeria nubilosa]|uniref:PDZ GRASP-type domain-containing protein n=1 Tax=Teratosphaeria nubilosa TaxID=161662 RepID=A0A6G1L005_9PEZI|nr:hypothetical protein EJ03DRAFT_318082 [Teratosphaeria nubilosa]